MGLFLGCHTGFNPRAQPRLNSPDQAADRTFQDARREFEAGRFEAARTAFDRFVQQYPDDPLRPFAQVYAGRAAYERGDYGAARAALEAPAQGPASSAATEQARFYLGLCRARMGECPAARAELEGFESRLASGDDTAELHAVLAQCGEKTGDLGLALAQWGAYYQAGRDHERAFARQKAQALADKVSAQAAARLYRSAPPESLARAVLGPKAATGVGGEDPGAQASILQETEKLRTRFGFGEAGGGPSARQDARMIGIVLPLSGPGKAQGQRALRGAALAVDAIGGGGLTLAVRDSGGDRAHTERAIEELANDEGVVAIVGPLDRNDADAAGQKAQSLGVPLIDLTVAPGPAPGPFIFHGVHDAQARVRGLVAKARAAGVRTVATLYPDNGYGRKMRDLFIKEAAQGGLQAAAQVPYEPTATGFTKPIHDLKGKRFDALFVPDLASRLELIAPALAAADLWPAPPGAPKPAGAGRNILLLSTAEDLSVRTLREGRYLQGALFAPGYFPEEDSFVQQYRTEHNEDPKLFEAFAYDAVHVVRAAVAAGSRTRAQVATQISAQRGVQGVTGQIRFAPGGDRADPAAVYTVSGDAVRRVD
jgi:branched-chain amino acid transport system substrate-binding protein